MADFMTTTQRSRAMSAVRGTESNIERVMRSELHRKGFRFRKNVKDLPGRPDIVLPKYHCAIFVHGCFWHQHKNCKRSKLPATRHAFWSKKLADNVRRDRRHVENLRRGNWRVFIIWECQLRQGTDQEALIEKLVSKIQNADVWLSNWDCI